MAIDWFTIGAQILNFLVLIYLLKRFLYRPVLDAIAAREKRIAGTLAEAATMKAEALKEREALHARNDAFDRDRTTLLAKATEAADGERKRVIEAARVAADALGEKQRQALARDARSMGDDIGRSARTEVFAIARKALADMADESLEARMTAIFIARLAALDTSAKRAASGMLDTANGPAVIRRLSLCRHRNRSQSGRRSTLPSPPRSPSPSRRRRNWSVASSWWAAAKSSPGASPTISRPSKRP